jgi:integrase
MGTLIKDARERSPYWYCCYTTADGRRLKKSTKQTDRREASKVCEAIEKAEELAKGGSASEEQIRKILDEILTRIRGRKLDDPTLREWLERWINGEKGAVSTATFDRYRGVINAFLKTLGPRANLRLNTLTTDDFTRFRDQLHQEGRSAKTVNLIVKKILSIPFKRAVDGGLLDRNPVGLVRPLRGTTFEKGVFTPEQVASLVEAAKGDWKGLILAGFYTGGRLSDLARLKWSEVDLAKRTITFWQKKTNTKVPVPIHPELEEYLLSASVCDSPEAPLFPTLYQTPIGGYHGLSMGFKKIMGTAGIRSALARERLGARGKNVAALSFHSLRHSFTSALANADVPAELRKILTGHADDQSHAVYTHHEFEKIRSAVQTLGRLPKIEER